LTAFPLVVEEPHILDNGVARFVSHERFDICASADRHATRYPETLPVATP
jgi:hypothetical protein